MTGNAPTHTCSYFCDKPECIKAQRDELRDKLAALESQPVPVEPECITKMRRLPKGAAYEVEHKTLDYIDTLQSALRVERATVETLTKTVEAFQSELKRVTVEPECPPDGWPINPHVRAWRIYAYALQSALQRAQEERDALSTTSAAQLSASYKRRAEAAESLNKRMVELLKEPSEGMINAGYPPNDERAQSWGVTEVFKAMSAELLKEVEK